MNKRTISLLLCLVLAFGLAACGETTQENTAEETKQTETEEKEGQDEKEQTEFKIGDEKYLKIYRRMSNFHLLLYVLLILLSILSLCKLL